MSRPQSRLAAARPFAGLMMVTPSVAGAPAGTVVEQQPVDIFISDVFIPGKRLVATGRLTNAQAERAYRAPLHVIHGQGARGSCGGPAR